MIKIENVVMPSPEQWAAVIRGMRNPKNSWDLSDSYTTYIEDPQTLERASYQFFVGDADKKLMQNLANAGSDHGKFLRMIPVYLDITAPLYWWKEFDTYKVGTVANSCSTMHKIHAKEFTKDDFSFDEDLFHVLIDHLDISEEDLVSGDNFYLRFPFESIVQNHIYVCECLRQMYLKTNDKRCWQALIQTLGESYNQRRTVMLNYQVLKNMYHARKNHKLAEWRELCAWIESLPHSDLIIGG